mgnify:CR=1 FL=1
MPIKVLEGDHLPTPYSHYSPGMVAGDFVFVAGQVGVDPDTGAVVADDIGTQTRRALWNIELILKDADCSLTDICRVFVYLRDLDDYAEMNKAYFEIMKKPFPPRSAVYVGMPDNLKVQIEVFAYKPRAGSGNG